ncbi:MAG TPA: intradiol ring-cleavage dioxygenase [Casimicrobiaceae bacterium]
MHDDPEARRTRTRRAALAAFGATGAVLLAARSFAQVARSDPPPACVLTPAQTEGPYFVDERLDRADIRSDPKDGSARPGALLALQLRVSAVEGARCAPVAGAIVDIWHCDAAGVYSDADDMGFRTRGSKFLRGYQMTDASGRVRFTTIYPGAYPGRAVHIHFKVRAHAAGRPSEFTSQLYFDDALTDRVHGQAPYAGRGERRTRNDRDGLYRRGGRELQLDVVSTGEGYAASYDVGIRLA